MRDWDTRENPKRKEWIMPATFVRLRSLAPLLAARVDSDAAVAYRGGDRWQPVFALYSRAARHLVRRRLAEGQRSLQGLLDALGARAVAPPDDWRRLINVNDREQLARARGLGGEDDGG